MPNQSPPLANRARRVDSPNKARRHSGMGQPAIPRNGNEKYDENQLVVVAGAGVTLAAASPAGAGPPGVPYTTPARGQSVKDRVGETLIRFTNANIGYPVVPSEEELKRSSSKNSTGTDAALLSSTSLCSSPVDGHSSVPPPHGPSHDSFYNESNSSSPGKLQGRAVKNNSVVLRGGYNADPIQPQAQKPYQQPQRIGSSGEQQHQQ